MKINELEEIRQNLNWTKKRLADEICLCSMSVHRYYSGSPIPESIAKLIRLIYKEETGV